MKKRIRLVEENILTPKDSEGKEVKVLELIYSYDGDKIRILIKDYNNKFRNKIEKEARREVRKYFANKIVEGVMRQK